MGDPGLIPGSERSPREGNGNPPLDTMEKSINELEERTEELLDIQQRGKEIEKIKQKIKDIEKRW